ALKALLAFVTLDYVTGLVAATVEKKLNSRVGLEGIARKVMIFSVVAVAHLADQVFGSGDLFRDGAVAFYLMNECLSILENAGRIGIPLPDGVREAVEALKDTSNTKKKEGNH